MCLKLGVIQKMKKILIMDLRSTTPAYTAYYAKSLADRGYCVDIDGIYKTAHVKDLLHFTPNYKKIINITGSGYRMSSIKMVNMIEYLINWLMVLMICKRYDCIHIQWLPLLKYSKVDLLFIRILKMRDIKIFYTAHNIFPHNNISKTVEKRYKQLYSMLDCIVVHSENTKDRLINDIKIESKRIIIIPHGPMFHDLELEVSVEKDSKTVGIMGNLSPYKGIEDAIEAIHILNKKNVYLDLILAGRIENEYKNKLLLLISKYNLERQVICSFGFIENREFLGMLRGLKMSLFPYRRIEQSGAAITSLSVGTPVVGYRVGGLRELVVDGYNGKLVNSGDIESLASAILEIKNKSNIDLEQNCKESIKKFSWEHAAEIMDGCFS